MTLTELLPLYKLNSTKKIILSHWQNEYGLEINNLEQFEYTLKGLGSSEMLLFNHIENDTILFYDFFLMMKMKTPYICVLNHPLLTNSFYKDIPDKIIDSFVDSSNNIYRYSFVDYGKQMTEYILEFSINIRAEIHNFCLDKMKKGFDLQKNDNSTLSIVFTNTNRFLLNGTNYVIYDLEDLYGDEWKIKSKTTLNTSKKLWEDIKKLK